MSSGIQKTSKSCVNYAFKSETNYKKNLKQTHDLETVNNENIAS